METRINVEVPEGIRQFNRFYTRQLGLLNECLLSSEFSLTEARVLYELAQCETTTARVLGRELMLDAGYLSRLLKKFEARNLISRTSSSGDGREIALRLTDAGRSVFAPLDEASRTQAASLVAHLDEVRQQSLLRAMRTIASLLMRTSEPAESYTLRSLQVGDIGWITHRQGLYYAQELGFDESFEALGGRDCCSIRQEFRCPARARLDRRALRRGCRFRVHHARIRRAGPPALAVCRTVGAVDSVSADGLTDECIRFARAKGYKNVTLWTNAQLLSARRLYEAAGFKRTAEEHGRKFGSDFHGQTWTLAL